MARNARVRRHTRNPEGVLGELLHRARLQASMTCEQAGRAARLTASQIAQAEDGDGSLLFVDVVPVLDAYGVSLSTFTASFEAALAADDAKSGGR